MQDNSHFWQRLVGRTLCNRYKLDGYIARGGMGAVYSGQDLALGRAVAVKVIIAALQPEPEVERYRKRFRQEAVAAARIRNHPNVVVVHDSGTDQEVDFLVMELLRGQPLYGWMAANPHAPIDLRIDILVQAARGIAAGHEALIVHRDVKPGNLMVLPGGAPGQVLVKVVDFGIARAQGASGREDTRLTQPGTFIGTESYASPEQLRCERDLTPASDVFSLGVLGYRLLTGKEPFTKQDLVRLQNDSPVHIRSASTVNPALPDAVSQVIMASLALKPWERLPDAGAFARALEDARQRSAAVPSAAPGPVWRDSPRNHRAEEMAGSTWHHGSRRPLGQVSQEPTDHQEHYPAAPRRRAADFVAAGRRDAAAAARRAGEALGRVPRRAWRLAGGVLAAAVLLAYAGPMGRSAAASIADAFVTTPEERLADARAANDEGRTQLDRDLAEQAIARFTRAVKLNPDNAEYRNNLGYAFMRAKRLPEAIGVLREVVERHPRRAVAHRNLAEAYLLYGDTAAAVEPLTRYSELGDRDGKLWARRKLRIVSQALEARRALPVDTAAAALPAYAPPAPGQSTPAYPVEMYETPRAPQPAPVRRRGHAPAETLYIDRRGPSPNRSGGYPDTIRFR